MPTDTSLSFKKPHTAIVMMPRVGKLTAMSRKLLNSMFNFAQKHLMTLPDGGKNFNAMDFFEQDLVDVIRPIGNPNSNSLEMMKDHIREMQSVIVDWTAPDQSQKIVWDSLVLVSQAKLRIENGRVRMLWSFPPDIVRSLANPEFFTVIRLQDLANLKSYVAVALYEIGVRYSTSPTSLTSRKTKEWWVAALSNDSHRRSLKDKTEPVLRDWRMFKREKVMPAIDEINSKTALRIELIEFKDGKAISDVQFRVCRVHSTEQSVKPDRAGPCFAAAAKLGIPQKDVAVFLERIFEPFSEDQVLLALAKVEGRVNKTGAVPVKSVVSYFRKIMSGLATPPLFLECNALDKPVKALPPSTNGAAVLQLKQEPGSSPRKAQLLGEFTAMPVDEQRLYAFAARDRLRSRGLLSPLLNHKIESGKWSTGVIADEIFHDLDTAFPEEKSPYSDGTDRA